MILQLLLLAAVALQPSGTVPYTEKVTPLSEQQIAAEWARTCFASGLDEKQLERALEGTAFKEGDLTMGGLRRNWTSPNGSLAFIRYVPTEPPIPLPQCNLTLFTSGPVNDVEFRAAMANELTQRLGAPPQHRIGRFGETWWWNDSAGKPLKVSRILMGEGSQQIELTLTPGEPDLAPADQPPERG